MKAGSYKISVGFDQVLDLVRQLSRQEKIRLSKELEKELIDSKLTALLGAFKTDALDEETIRGEAEVVRAELTFSHMQMRCVE
jgi:hypothetical protein